MNKLKVKDLVIIGSLNAVMIVLYFAIGGIMSMSPVTNVFYPAVAAIPNGIIMMLLLTKVSKRGVFTISGIIQGLILVLVGAFWILPVCTIIGGIICDFVIMGGNLIKTKTISIRYAVYSGFYTFGVVGPIKIMQQAYIAVCRKHNLPDAYIDTLIKMTSAHMLILIVISGVLGGILGALLGQKMLKKHFIKAGLVVGTGCETTK